MAVEHRPGELRLRPHHIMCEQFLSIAAFDRGEAFNTMAHRIKDALRLETDTSIEMIEGVDDLCQTCPLCQRGLCQSPQGDETQVRRWDAVVVKGLGISYGDRMTAGGFSALIRQKVPLSLCLTRCRWKSECRVPSPP